MKNFSNVITSLSVKDDDLKNIDLREFYAYIASSPTEHKDSVIKFSLTKKDNEYNKYFRWFSMLESKYSININDGLDIFSKPNNYQGDMVEKFNNNYKSLKDKIVSSDFIIAFGPNRYDVEVTMSELKMKPIFYYVIDELLEESFEDFMKSLPLAPYFSPYCQIYNKVSLPAALSHFIKTAL